jgi:hypothetical protein
MIILSEFWLDKLKKRGYLEVTGVGGEDDIKSNKEIWSKIVDWINLAQGRDKCLAVVDNVKKVRIS